MITSLLLLVACIPGKKVMLETPFPTVTYNPFATLSPTPFFPLPATDSPVLRDTAVNGAPTLKTPAPATEKTKYTIIIEMDYAAHSLKAQEEVTFWNSTGRTLDKLLFIVEANREDGCFTLTELTGASVEGYSLNGAQLDVDLDPALAPGEAIEVNLQFSISLPAADYYHVFGHKADQINLVNWFPYAAAFRDGWLIHQPGKVGEHQAYEVADFDISLLSTGEEQPWVVAAATLPDGNHYLLENARTFSLSISDKFLIATCVSGGITVNSYFFLGEETQGRRVLDEVCKAIPIFIELFGPFPYPSLSIVETEYHDGLEFDGLFFLGQKFYLEDDGTKLNYLVDLAIHETAHQWWFGQVGNDQALEPWLDESLATYSEFLFYEKVYPGVADAWWNFRVDSHAPEGPINLDIYSSGDFQTYANGAYLRGAEFQHELRTRLGDEVFFDFLKNYAREMKGRIATAEDFFRVLESHTSKDLSEVIWLYFSTK